MIASSRRLFSSIYFIRATSNSPFVPHEMTTRAKAIEADLLIVYDIAYVYVCVCVHWVPGGVAFRLKAYQV